MEGKYDAIELEPRTDNTITIEDNIQSNIVYSNDSSSNFKFINNMQPVKIYGRAEKIKLKDKIVYYIDEFFTYFRIILPYLLIILHNAFYLFIINHKRCKDQSYFNCRLNYDTFDFLLKSYLVILDSLLLSITIFYLVVTKKLKVLMLLVCNLIVLYSIDAGYVLQSFGGYVRNAQLLLVFAFTLINLLVYLCYVLYTKVRAIGILYILAIIGAGYLIKYYIFVYSCRDWKKGLGDSEITNHDITCVTPKPPYCSYIILDGIYDLPYWFNQRCEEELGDISLLVDNSPVLKNLFNQTEYNNVIKTLDLNKITSYIGNVIPIIGFPRSEKYNRTSDTLYKKAQSFVLNRLHIIDDSFDMKKHKIEYFLKYNKTINKYEPKIDLYYDRDLAFEKNLTFDGIFRQNKNEYDTKRTAYIPPLKTNEGIDLEELKLKPLTKNVLVFFSDATSRRHFFRKYPKLMKIFDRHYNNKTSTLASYQFMKHQTLYPGTLANIGAAYFGTFNKNSGFSVLRKFKKHGFMLGGSQNICSAEVIDINEDDPVKYEFQDQDHEFWAPFCDVNQQPTSGFYNDFKGPYSALKKCMWEKQSIDWSIEYARQFLNKYKDQHKIFRLGTADSHETSGEVIRYVDDSIADFIDELEANGTLEETTLLVFSDHGQYSNGWYPRYFETADYEIEMELPGLFVLLPKSVKNFDKIDVNMKSRENTMTTAFDVYKTLISIIDGDETKESFLDYGKGLFYTHENEAKNYNCDKYGTRDWVCMCKPIANVTLY